MLRKKISTLRPALKHIKRHIPADTRAKWPHKHLRIRNALFSSVPQLRRLYKRRALIRMGMRVRWPHKHLRIYITALLFGVALQLFLFLRPTPFGLPYVMNLSSYLPHAMFYACYGVSLASAPFFLLAAFLGRRAQKPLLWAHILLLTGLLALTHLDNEILRFFGMHLSVDALSTYGIQINVPTAIHHAVRDDAGGRYLSAWLLLLPPLFALTAALLAFRVKINAPLRAKRMAVIAAIVAFLFLPFLFRTSLFGSKNRQQKVAPIALVLLKSFQETFQAAPDYSDIGERIQRVQNRWLRANTQDGWRFPAPGASLLRTFDGTCPTYGDAPWNFVVIAVETFRALNVPLFHAGETIDATPHLSALARSDDAAFYTRYICNSQPTVYAFMALHTGILPHSRKTVAKAFAHKHLDSYASILRQHGYHAAFFGGSDPDWDNQRLWLTQWYDHVYFDKADNEEDRKVMRQLAQYLKNRPDADQPFVATTFLISNHVPFSVPEAAFRDYEGRDLKQRIRNTLRYDDDVLREFFAAIQNEPWFPRTVFFITGDHAMDLGERGAAQGPENTRHETNWVPLIIYGQHPLRPAGQQGAPASHVDIAPSILHMAGICADNRFMGHSLFATRADRMSYNVHAENYGLETAAHSLYLPKGDKPQLYRAADQRQETDISAAHPDEVERLTQIVHDWSAVADHGYEVEFP
ncbi:MAG: LTA synthase family protein [Proteobacteria bacterium]|nr:LTA synthase family protein [Pseudomonadota bacterium]